MNKPGRPVKLSADLAEARALAAHLQLNESINALSHSFSSSGLIARLVELDRDSSRHRLQSTAKVIQANPLPFVLIGAGVAYLLCKPVMKKATGGRTTGPTKSSRVRQASEGADT